MSKVWGSKTAVLTLGSLAVILLLCGVTLLGGLDWLANDGHVDRSVVTALAIYWSAFWLVVWVLRGRLARPKEAHRAPPQGV